MAARIIVHIIGSALHTVTVPCAEASGDVDTSSDELPGPFTKGFSAVHERGLKINEGYVSGDKGSLASLASLSSLSLPSDEVELPNPPGKHKQNLL